MDRLAETGPIVKIDPKQMMVRIYWTRRGRDGVSIVETGESLVLTQHAALALGKGLLQCGSALQIVQEERETIVRTLQETG